MPKLTPVKQKVLLRKLREFGFEGPFAGGKHLFMIKWEIRLTLPNPHHKEIGVDLLKRILHQAEIPTEEWIKTK
jgi:predicted RNA binding protein YcfA (HicA-like mRNA interferase family)